MYIIITPPLSPLPMPVDIITFFDFCRKMKRRMRKTRNEKTWKARPASRMLFAVVGDLRFDWATPMRAAPATCTIVATTSAVMKIARMVRLVSPNGLSFRATAASSPDSARMKEVRVV